VLLKLFQLLLAGAAAAGRGGSGGEQIAVNMQKHIFCSKPQGPKASKENFHFQMKFCIEDEERLQLLWSAQQKYEQDPQFWIWHHHEESCRHDFQQEVEFCYRLGLETPGVTDTWSRWQMGLPSWTSMLKGEQRYPMTALQERPKWLPKLQEGYTKDTEALPEFPSWLPKPPKPPRKFDRTPFANWHPPVPPPPRTSSASSSSDVANPTSTTSAAAKPIAAPPAGALGEKIYVCILIAVACGRLCFIDACLWKTSVPC